MVKKILAISIVALIACTQAIADNLSYNYVSLKYIDVDGGNGIGVAGSLAINDSFFMELSLDDIEEVDRSTVAFGFHNPINDTTDFYTKAFYQHFDTDFGSTSMTGLALGVRSMVSDRVELGANWQYVDIEDEGSDDQFNLSAGVFVTDSLFLNLDYGTEDEITQLALRFDI